jgi:hypothetical protein
MESPHVDLRYVFNEHKCIYCNKSHNRYTLEELRHGAKYQCPAFGLWLACVEWAVPELFEYSDFESIVVHNSSITFGGRFCLHYRLDVFQVKGKFA